MGGAVRCVLREKIIGGSAESLFQARQQSQSSGNSHPMGIR